MDERLTGGPLAVETCIVTYGSAVTAIRAVESLRALGPGARVAIHDNTPTPLDLHRVREVVKSLGLAFRAEHCPDNCGFSRGCNALAQSSTSDLLLFLNPDAELVEWPDHLAVQASRSIVGPIVEDDRGRPMKTFGQKRTIGEEFLIRWARIRPRVPAGKGYVSGAALLVPRDVFAELGGFDESFFMYYEDIDLCVRANHSGIPVGVDSAWIVRHQGGHAAGRDQGTALIRSYESAVHFYSKHGMDVGLYRRLCRIDATMKLALFTLLPSRRASVPGMRRLLARINAVS